MTEPVPPPTWRQRLDLIAGTVPERPAQAMTVAAVVAAVALVGWFLLRQPPRPPAEAAMVPVTAGATTTTSSGNVVVHAAGAVVAPGLYTLRAGARVADLLAAAGGPTAEADLDRLNLAAPVIDGAQVFVPRIGEPVPTAGSTGGVVDGGAATAGPVDLNLATAAELESLPGIGPATAAAILAEREKRGGFRAVEDLLDVRGIGPAKFEALRDLVTV